MSVTVTGALRGSDSGAIVTDCESTSVVNEINIHILLSVLFWRCLCSSLLTNMSYSYLFKYIIIGDTGKSIYLCSW